MNISATTKYFFRIMSIHIESSKVRIFYSDRERSLGNTLGTTLLGQQWDADNTTQHNNGTLDNNGTLTTQHNTTMGRWTTMGR